MPMNFYDLPIERRMAMLAADPELAGLLEAFQEAEADHTMLNGSVAEVLDTVRAAARRMQGRDRVGLEHSIGLVEDALKEKLAALTEESRRRWAALKAAADRKLALAN